MRVFIIGAGGYIGGHVAAGLAARGHEVVALAHTEPLLMRFKELGYTPVFGNMLHDEAWRTEAARSDGLVNRALWPVEHHGRIPARPSAIRFRH